MDFSNNIVGADFPDSGELRTFLIDKGWISYDKKNDYVEVLVRPEDESQQIDIPIIKDDSSVLSKDYRILLRLAFEKASSYYDKSFSSFCKLLLSYNSDVIKFRVASSTTSNGMIPYDEGLNLLKNAKKSLYSAACDIENPIILHPRLKMKKVDEFFSRCRLGQTEKGSFVASIYTPLFYHSNYSDDNGENIEASFSRKVTEKFMLSLAKLKELSSSNNMEDIESQSRPEMSSNFVESIVKMGMLNDDGSELEVHTELFDKEDLTYVKQSPIVFKSGELQSAKIWVEKIKAFTPKDVFLTGRVGKIEANPDKDSRENAYFTLFYLDEEHKARSVRVEISTSNIHITTEAFEEGKYVKVKGTIEGQRNKRIKDATIEVIA